MHKTGIFHAQRAHPFANPLLKAPDCSLWGAAGAVHVLLVGSAFFYVGMCWSYDDGVKYIPISLFDSYKVYKHDVKSLSSA